MHKNGQYFPAHFPGGSQWKISIFMTSHLPAKNKVNQFPLEGRQKMKPEWLKKTLGSNVRYFRSELGMSQLDLSVRSGVSNRLLQSIEGGSGNPTLDSIQALANTFRMTVSHLLELHFLRIEIDGESFLQEFKKAFSHSDLRVTFRTPSGKGLWMNKAAELVHGSVDFSKGPVDIGSKMHGVMRTILDLQMATEREGAALSYTIARENQDTGEQIFFRCHPTLILPAKGREPLFTVVYLECLGERDDEEKYYQFCNILLECVHDCCCLGGASGS
jgi:transcriptional regulator with XRE-family HTH domain